MPAPCSSASRPFDDQRHVRYARRPLRPRDRLDIVNVDFVASSIVALHQKEKTLYDVYHLSSGIHSPTCRQITEAIGAARGRKGPFYLPSLVNPFKGIVNWMANRRGTSVGHLGSLLKVFLPYLLWNTVFDNQRVVHEVGQHPVPFPDYCYPLYDFSVKHNFAYPYQEWPALEGSSTA